MPGIFKRTPTVTLYRDGETAIVSPSQVAEFEAVGWSKEQESSKRATRKRRDAPSTEAEPSITSDIIEGE